MQICGSQYGVFDVATGKWQWFSDRAEAARVEAEQLRQRIKRKVEAGEQVILTDRLARVAGLDEAANSDKPLKLKLTRLLPPHQGKD
jgi:hypothetical protein